MCFKATKESGCDQHENPAQRTDREIKSLRKKIEHWGEAPTPLLARPFAPADADLRSERPDSQKPSRGAAWHRKQRGELERRRACWESSW